MVKPLAQVVAAGASMAMHLNFGDGYGYIYRCVEEKRITVHIGGPKTRKSKREKYKHFKVEGIADEFLTFEEAWMALDKIDQRAAQDKEWEAAAPKKPKPAYIPGILEEP